MHQGISVRSARTTKGLVCRGNFVEHVVCQELKGFCRCSRTCRMRFVKRRRADVVFAAGLVERLLISGQSDMYAQRLSDFAIAASRELIALRATSGARRGEHANQRMSTPAVGGRQSP